VKLKCWACALLGLLLAATMLRAGDIGDAFEAREFKGANGRILRYRLLKPAKIDPAVKYPLVLFCHGAGERGTDNRSQLKNGIEAFVKPENREKFPCFVFAPQVPQNQMWVDTPWSLDKHTIPAKPTETMSLSLELLGALRKEFNVDEKRLYVTGVSMGGFGTWDALCRWPELFAAAVPCCGGADEAMAPRIAKIPVWTFHGDKDGVVKTSRTRNMVAALKAAGGAPKYTEYPGVGHDSWNKAFAEPELLPWLFAQHRP
jgi:predicted peptidase